MVKRGGGKLGRWERKGKGGYYIVGVGIWVRKEIDCFIHITLMPTITPYGNMPVLPVPVAAHASTNTLQCNANATPSAKSTRIQKKRKEKILNPSKHPSHLHSHPPISSIHPSSLHSLPSHNQPALLQHPNHLPQVPQHAPPQLHQQDFFRIRR